ncbi:MAG: S9 family peptidase [Planctomycetota bacterium]
MARSFSASGVLVGTLVAVLGITAGEASAQPKKLTLEQVSGRGDPVNFSGRTVRVSWTSDGRHLQLERDGKTVTVDPVTGADVADAERAREGVTGEREAGKAEGARDLRAACAQALAAAGIDKEMAGRLSRRARERGETFLVAHDGDLYSWRAGQETARRLTQTPAVESAEELSPDGRFVAFRRDANLYLAGTGDGLERALSTDGSDTLLYARLDWVYQEEVYGRGTWDAKWWSPDSEWLAFLKIDQSAVHEFTVIDHIPYRLSLNVTRYPKAGDPNPVASLGVASSSTGEVTWVDLSGYAGAEPLIVRVTWSPDSEWVLFQVQDREQTWLELVAGDPETGRVETLIRETAKTWVNVLEEPRWLADGSFLWASERTGYRHLYRYDLTGRLIAQVTSGNWNCLSVETLDEGAEELYVVGTSDSAVDRHLYRVGLRGEGLLRLTRDRGAHNVSLNGDRSLFIDRFSTVSTPPEVRLCRKDGTVIRTIARAEIPALREYAFSTPELLEIPARDGFLLDATLIKPPDFDMTKSYPVWLPTYSGPDAPSVRNAWGGSSWHQFLAQQGLLVFQVNNRSSSTKGKGATDACYRQLGVSELRDIEDAVDWLCRHPWADGSRVGITGGSYGGFMAAYAVTHSKKFALGIAEYGVYDWRCYDTIYTERYMATPAHNPEGYKLSSCVEAAADLHGHLVLVHGAVDDNVHLQNVMQFAYALQRADKPFEMMLYPLAGHGIGDSAQRWHERQLIWRAIEEHLLRRSG